MKQASQKRKYNFDELPKRIKMNIRNASQKTIESYFHTILLLYDHLRGYIDDRPTPEQLVQWILKKSTAILRFIVEKKNWTESTKIVKLNSILSILKRLRVNRHQDALVIDSYQKFHKQLKEVIKLDQFPIRLAFFDRGLYKSVPFLG